jgi:hypothetical protein
MGRKLVALLPEFLLFGVALFWFLEHYLGSGTVFYPALIVGLCIGISIFWKQRILRLLLATGALVFAGYYIYIIFQIWVNRSEGQGLNTMLYFMLILVLISLFSGISLVFKALKKEMNF